MHQGRQTASGDLRLDGLDLTWIEHKPGKREPIEILWCVLECPNPMSRLGRMGLEMCDCTLWLGGGADSHPLIRFLMTKYLLHHPPLIVIQSWKFQVRSGRPIGAISMDLIRR